MNMSKIVRYWHAVEMLQQQEIPKPEKRKPSSPCTQDISLSVLMPWHEGGPLDGKQIQAGYEWRHQIYALHYEAASFQKVLKEKFGATDGYLEPVTGASSTYSLRINAAGEYIEGSFVLSSAAWALGRIFGGKDWSSGFDKSQSDLESIVREKLDGPVDGKGMLALSAKIISELGLEDFLNQQHRYRCTSTPCKPSAEENRGEDQLNSFIVNDLSRVATALDGGSISNALSEYLSFHAGTNRIDVRSQKNAEFLLDTLAIDSYPQGCWPTPGGRGLVYSQQLAVNLITSRLSDSDGLMSVNGPPGTGKTTLLRDIIAAVVTQRADVLAGYARPSQAFVKGEGKKISYGGKYLTAWNLCDEMLGYEIVVASSNNGAVNNVTKELPELDSVADSTMSTCDYFSAIGSDLINGPAWGVVSAALGSKSNRGEFIRKFWNSKDGVKQWLQSKAAMFQESPDLKVSTWSEAVERYQMAKDRASEIAVEASKTKELLKEVHNSGIKLNDASEKVNIGRIEITDLSRRADHIEQIDLVNARAYAVSAESLVASHESLRPGFMANLLSLWGASKEWSRRKSFLANDLVTCRHQVDVAVSNLSRLSTKIRAVEDAVNLNKSEVDRLEQRISNITQVLRCIADKFGSKHLQSFIDSKEVHTYQERELSEPWLIPEWRQAKGEVFLEALNLHMAFMAIESKRLKMNLATAVSVLNGGSFGEVSAHTMQSVWASLFLFVPVLSSTFASFDKTFRTLGESSIGWLLIDEAGQSSPQAAVGAIWRSRRAVVVGDPLQLEPVMTTPESVLEFLRNYFRVDRRWTPSKLSAQRLADEANFAGTYIGPSDEKQWVGLPLSVHRRCARPMFEIANAIAYGGSMVYGTIAPKMPSLASVATGWIDVKGISETNWVGDEGKTLIRLLNVLFKDGVLPQSIYVITPFAAVRKELSPLLRDLKVTSGTVHTMQGKEAEVVIVVLGGRSDTPGARNWAVSKPNLLNVAVTRAKQRLYVIGDREDWGRRELMQPAQLHLPPVSLNTVSEIPHKEHSPEINQEEASTIYIDGGIKADSYFIGRSLEICWKCSELTRVHAFILPEFEYQEAGEWNGLNIFVVVHFITDLASELVMKIQSFAAAGTYKHVYSKTSGEKYWANLCEHCKAIQGDYFLACEPGGAFCPTSETEAKAIKLFKQEEAFICSGTFSTGVENYRDVLTLVDA